MGLSCSCDTDWDGEGWYYIEPSDYSELTTSKRKRCCSCSKLIDISSIVAVFQRYRGPKTLVEENIYGEDGEISIASWYMCEECADMYYSLADLGFCIYLGDQSMRELTTEYASNYSK